MSDSVLELHSGSDIVLLARFGAVLGSHNAAAENCALPALMRALSMPGNLTKLRSNWSAVSAGSIEIKQLSDDDLIEKIVADVAIGRVKAVSRQVETFGFISSKAKTQPAEPMRELPRQRVTPSMRTAPKLPPKPEPPRLPPQELAPRKKPPKTKFDPRVAAKIEQLVQALKTASGAEEIAVADEIARLCTHVQGAAKRTVLGKWDDYINEAKANGGRWYETPETFFNDLSEGLTEAEAKRKALLVNQRFLQQQIESGIDEIQLVGESVEEVLSNRPDSFTAQEIKYLTEHAGNAYKRVGNVWKKVK